MTKNSIIIIVLILLSLAGTFFFHNELSEMKLKNVKLNQANELLKKSYEKCATDYASVLEEHNKMLRKELVVKYLNSIVDFDAKTTDGYQFSTEESEKIKDRITFVLENMQLLQLDKEKAFEYISFLASVQKKLEKQQ